MNPSNLGGGEKHLLRASAREEILHGGLIGLTVLGLVFLAVTGAETLYADLGHFGRKPIQAAWLGLALPALTLNYRGLMYLELGRLDEAIQDYDRALQIDGANSILFHGSHHEKLWGAYQISNNTGIGTKGVTIADAAFEGDVGVNGGSGYLLNVATTIASGIVFTHNQIYGGPDWVVSGTNLAQVIYQDNQYSGSLNVPPTSGITTQLAPAPSINIGGVHSVGLNPSATPIRTIQSALGPGEMVTFFTLNGTVTFAAGGNIDLMGLNQVQLNGSMTFVRNDLTGGWTPVSQWPAR